MRINQASPGEKAIISNYYSHANPQALQPQLLQGLSSLCPAPGISCSTVKGRPPQNMHYLEKKPGLSTSQALGRKLAECDRMTATAVIGNADASIIENTVPPFNAMCLGGAVG